MTIAMCNSCLRVREFASYKDACEANCECGADNGDYVSSAFCPCDLCSSIAARLLAAEGDQDQLREVLTSDDFEGAAPESFSWTAAGGLIIGERAQ